MALVLAVCLAIPGAVPATTYAASRGKAVPATTYAASRARAAAESTYGWSSLRDFLRSLFGGQEKQEENFDRTPAPGVELAPLDTGDTTGLRATSYQAVAESGGDRATTIKYFPATLYDYIRSTTNAYDFINKAGYELELAENVSSYWKNLYFYKAAPDTQQASLTITEPEAPVLTYVPVTSADDIVNGETYYLMLKSGNRSIYIKPNSNYLIGEAVAEGSTVGANIPASNVENITAWTVTKSETEYTFKNGNQYINVESKDSKTAVTVSSTPTPLRLAFGGGYVNIYRYDSNKSYYLRGDSINNEYRIRTKDELKDNDDYRFVLCKREEIAQPQTQVISKNLPFAGWNYWTGNEKAGNNPRTITTNRDTSAYIYSGLVKAEYESGAISFAHVNIDLFGTENTNYKNVYTGVGIPFVYDPDTCTYTFDSDKTGAYFAEGTAQSNTNLEYSPYPSVFYSSDYKQYRTGFFPFNYQTNTSKSAIMNAGGDTTGNLIGGKDSFGGESLLGADDNYDDNDKRCRTANLFFGMQATIPCTMTSNGRLVANDDASAPIEFNFAGDDDVWVFIDGKLVLDLGGIHDSVSGTINFANNTITYGATNSSKASGDVANVYKDNSPAGSVLKKSQGKLFNEGTESGKLGQDRASFAATTNHTLTIYYLERGAGLSNCKIQFNLPMNDIVTVKKEISPLFADETPVPEEIMSQVSSTRFGFTLYKGAERVTDRIYTLYNADGTVHSTPSTDAYGKFYLTNGQKASFIGNIADNNSYHVVEDALAEIWSTPAWSYDTNISGASETLAAANMTSMTVSVAGNAEKADELNFVCENKLNALPEIALEVQDITIVLDYGLPVEINLSNAITLATGGTVTEIANLNDDGEKALRFGTLSEVQNQKITYTLNKQLTDMETLHFRAVLTPSSSLQSGGVSKNFCVYILPATQMYYEENFGDMVIFAKRDGLGAWREEGSSQNLRQEEGVVGTPNDSPYGSDVAYRSKSGDSNGTSRYVSTQGNNGALFEYTFTGIGTSIYARTTLHSGYIYVAFYNESNQKVHDFIRDTSYKGTESDTLYNIPVYTWMAPEYGTYRVVVSIAKETTLSYKPNPDQPNYATTNCYEFWLDGIKVFRPMNLASQHAGKANAAYAADAEQHDSVVTLREKLLSDYTTPDENGITWNPENGYVIFTDTNGAITLANEYRSNGPKEEVYLGAGQSITFSVAGWDADRNFIYLGAKAPMSPGEITVGSSVYTVTNTVDCYYSIKNAAVIAPDTGIATFTITNTGNTVISLTNIKVTGTPNFVIIDANDVSGEGNTEVVVDEESGDQGAMS